MLAACVREKKPVVIRHAFYSFQILAVRVEKSGVGDEEMKKWGIVCRL